MTAKEYSIKQLRSQLQYLTEELQKTTEKIQLQEIFDNSNSENPKETDQEIIELIKKQNVISHEIITVKKRIKKLSAKTILKAELFILPVVVVLLFFVATNYSIQPIEQANSIRTYHVNEDLQAISTSNYKYWDFQSNSPLNVNINNNANVNEQKIQAVKNAIVSTDKISQDDTVLYNSDPITNTAYFRGWQGAIDTISINPKHEIPTKFNLIQSNNGEGDIVVTLSTLKSENGYSAVTRTITDGNQILKAFITIYDSDKLSDIQIESIVRHEFGRALGLSYADDSKGIMTELTNTNSYISQCDISALEKSYNEEQIPENFCSK